MFHEEPCLDVIMVVHLQMFPACYSEALISSNRSDHYWSDQLTNEWKCDCDKEAEVEDDNAALVPPHRSDHFLYLGLDYLSM